VERLVEALRRFGHVGADEHRRAEGVVNGEGRPVRMVHAPWVAAVEPAFVEARRHGIEVKDQLPQAGEGEGAVLEAAVAEGEPRAGHAPLGPLVEALDQTTHGPRPHQRVGVEEEVVARMAGGGGAHPLVVGRAKAGVGLVGDDVHLWEEVGQQSHRAVGRGVVHHPDFAAQPRGAQIGGHRAQAVRQIVADVPTDDNDGNVDHLSPVLPKGRQLPTPACFG